MFKKNYGRLRILRDAATWLGADKKRRDVCQHLPMMASELLNTFLYLDIFGWSYLVLRMRDGPLTILKRLLCLEKALQQ